MKFNPQLKIGLENLFQKKPVPEEPRPEPRTIPSFDRSLLTRREIVVGGTIKWKAVNKLAAMLIRPAPWWAHPPPEPTKEEEKINETVQDNKHRTLRTPTQPSVQPPKAAPPPKAATVQCQPSPATPDKPLTKKQKQELEQARLAEEKEDFKKVLKGQMTSDDYIKKYGKV